MMGIRERLNRSGGLRIGVSPVDLLSEAEKVSLPGHYAARRDTDISLAYDRTRQMDVVGLRRWRR